MSDDPTDGSEQRELDRVTSGDRRAIAEFLLANEDIIRRRISGKLGPRMRSVFDSQEIMSTVLRRLDQYALRGGFDVSTERQLWSLINRVLTHAVTDKARIAKRLRSAEHEDAALARAMLSTTTDDAGDPLEHRMDAMLGCAFAALDDEIDRDILWLWLTENSHAVIADHLGMEPAAVRKRWQRIRDRLRDELAENSARWTA